jgi:ElaB/YqjD/DUF883 family membrane-anchored ribosome-binding protein
MAVEPAKEVAIMTTQKPATAQLMEDLRVVVEDAEALLKATAGQAGERVDQARKRAEESVSAARERLAELEGEFRLRARDAARTTDRYVHENPWGAIGIAAGVGFILGLLSGRR